MTCPLCRAFKRSDDAEVKAALARTRVRRFLMRCAVRLDWALPMHLAMRLATRRLVCGGCARPFLRDRANRPPWAGAVPVCPTCRPKLAVAIIGLVLLGPWLAMSGGGR